VANWASQWLPRIVALGGDKRLPLVATLLVLLLLAQGLATLTWRVIPSQEVDSLPAPVAPGSPAARSANKPLEAANIYRWHLFGEVQKEEPKPVATVTEAPDTRLNLKLLGVVASSDPAAARAIIADGRNSEESYAVGDSLPGSAILREIYADRVILEHRGRLEALRLPKEGVPGSMDASPSPRGGRAASQRAVVTSSNADTSALLRQYRDALMTNPQSVMNLVQASPVTDETTGKLKGYRISPGRDRALLGRFGLKSGDVVTAVNGVTLDNPIKALEIMRDLSSASQVSVEVERNGSMQTFAFQVE
jgi:general secretion pathway protein C